jgi:hypothetical protein
MSSAGPDLENHKACMLSQAQTIGAPARMRSWQRGENALRADPEPFFGCDDLHAVCVGSSVTAANAPDLKRGPSAAFC